MWFWLFFCKRKASKSVQKRKSAGVQEKMGLGRESEAGNVIEDQGQRLSLINSKRRRTSKPNILSKPPSSGLRESTATGSHAEATMSSSWRTRAGSVAQSGREPPNSVPDQHRVYHHNPKSNPSIGQDIFTVTAVPTLNAKRGNSESAIPRRKSSKRKAEDQARERELRAISSLIAIPKRSLSRGEGPLRRDTQKASTHLRKNADRHTSKVSLPMPESLTHIGITSDQNSFVVNALDMLSPRPTVRYSKNSRHTASKSHISSKNPVWHAIAEENSSLKKRIDDLADNLDAGALRELMERDKRRRERKRKADQLKVKQEVKRTADSERRPEGRELENTQVGGEKDKAGPGIGSCQDDTHLVDVDKDIPASPFLDDQTEPGPPEAPRLRVGSSIYAQNSQASFSPPTPPSQRAVDCASLSQISGLRREATPDTLDMAKLSHEAPGQSNVQLGSWSTFFRRSEIRGKTSPLNRGRNGSEEFCNISRDSISRSQPQASMVGAARIFRRSGIPQRTQSKFREDLPELPLSPPDSRVHSPEIGKEPVVVPDPPNQLGSTADGSTLLSNSSSRASLDQYLNDGAPDHLQAKEPQTPPPAAALSRSLASVDSEASWLSGKPAKRSSVQHDRPFQQSQPSLHPRVLGSDIGDEVDVADDPYFTGRSPQAEERRRSSPSSGLRKASSTVLSDDPESNSEAEPEVRPLPNASSERWHPSIGRQPTLIRQANQARSKEGLLNEYLVTDAETKFLEAEVADPDSPDMDNSDLQATRSPIFRAQSITYGQGHIRHISAGSAKLLDIRPSSPDFKRQSLPRVERSSNPIRSTTLRRNSSDR